MAGDARVRFARLTVLWRALFSVSGILVVVAAVLFVTALNGHHVVSADLAPTSAAPAPSSTPDPAGDGQFGEGPDPGAILDASPPPTVGLPSAYEGPGGGGDVEGFLPPDSGSDSFDETTTVPTPASSSALAHQNGSADHNLAGNVAGGPDRVTPPTVIIEQPGTDQTGLLAAWVSAGTAVLTAIAGLITALAAWRTSAGPSNRDPPPVIRRREQSGAVSPPAPSSLS